MLAVGTLCASLVLLLFRALYVICRVNRRIPNGARRRRPAKTMIILGSGGHTTEMLRVVAGMRSDRYSPRIYVRAWTDVISEAKVRELEGDAPDFRLLAVRRSREVHQPYVAAVWTTLVAIFDSVPVLYNQRPDLILCNGPGTCVPLCLVAFVCKLLFAARIRVIFVESFCRVRTLSLSGKILYYLADFVVTEAIVMELDRLASELLSSESLLDDIEGCAPPEIALHLMPIYGQLRLWTNGDRYTRSRGWLENASLTLEACLDRTWESLNSGCWRGVPIDYRYCYSFCTILKSVLSLTQLRNEAAAKRSKKLNLDTLRKIILQIDKGILLGAPPPSAPGLLQSVARKLSSIIVEASGDECFESAGLIGSSDDGGASARSPLPGFGAVSRCYQPSMEAFHRDIFRSKTPAVLEGCMGHWRALELWRDPEYLMRTAGVRTVPIEIGSRYTDVDWTQRLVTFAELLRSHVTSDKASRLGYLAQHELFDQIPELMDDISIPDYCAFSDTGDVAAKPDVNAWLGPGGTVSPLHFDPKNNLLCQVFGIKRVVLFHPEQTQNLYPYETRLLSNTAQVDPLNPDFGKWPKFKSASGVTCTLEPGDMLFIPPGWWHHVVALAPSFSVSFWWD